jgi:sortase A
VTNVRSEGVLISKVVGGARIVRRAALVCLALGALLLSFVAYQLWGTALYEHHAQALLTQELTKTLGVKPETGPKAQSAPKLPTGPAQTLVSRTAPTLAEPALNQPIGFMSIPRIGMTDDAIIEGAGEAQLQQGPGHYAGTSLPGEAGNAAIAGHRTTYAHPFYNLDQMQPGDLIYIQTAQGLFEYEVSYSKIVPPSDVSVLDPSTTPELTLTTCNPRYSATSRLVVVSVLKTSVTSSSFTSATTATTTPGKPAALPTSLAGEGGGIGGISTIGQVKLALLWGALTVVALWLAVMGWQRIVRRPWAWSVLGVGLPVAVVLLLVCFQHVSLALPEAF